MNLQFWRRSLSQKSRGAEASLAAARALALHLLARREHSRQELHQKLSYRGFASADISTVLAQLAAAGFQSDERFSEVLVRQRVNGGYGVLRIRAELRYKGLSDELIQQALEPFTDSWVDVATKAYQKRFGDKAPDAGQERARRICFLQSRGFTTGEIERILEAV